MGRPDVLKPSAVASAVAIEKTEPPVGSVVGSEATAAICTADVVSVFTTWV